MDDLRSLTARFPRAGRLEAIVLRPGRDAPAVSVPSTRALPERGLEGDRRGDKAASRPGGGKRQVTLIQAEHLPLIRAWTGVDVAPAELRRNLVISGINLLALRRCVFSIGDVVLAGTGLCAPCSRMEAVLGGGGYNAMRGHGGITARVVEGGAMRLGDAVRFLRLQD